MENKINYIIENLSILDGYKQFVKKSFDNNKLDKVELPYNINNYLGYSIDAYMNEKFVIICVKENPIYLFAHPELKKLFIDSLNFLINKDKIEYPFIFQSMYIDYLEKLNNFLYLLNEDMISLCDDVNEEGLDDLIVFLRFLKHNQNNE